MMKVTSAARELDSRVSMTVYGGGVSVAGGIFASIEVGFCQALSCFLVMGETILRARPMIAVLLCCGCEVKSLSIFILEGRHANK